MYVFLQRTPLSSPKLYALGIPPQRVVWILLFWRARWSVLTGLVDPYPDWLPGPALCRWRWLLVVTSGHETADWRTPGGFEASAGSLLGGAEFWGPWMQAPWGSTVDFSPLIPRSGPGVPGLVPAHWWMELDLVVSGYGALGVPGDGFGCWWVG